MCLRGLVLFYSAMVNRSAKVFRCQRARASSRASPMAAQSKPPAQAASTPAWASSTTRQFSGERPIISAAFRNTSGWGLEWVMQLPSATASKKSARPIRSRMKGGVLFCSYSILAKTIALPKAEISRLRARPKGSPVALWKPSELSS